MIKIVHKVNAKLSTASKIPGGAPGHPRTVPDITARGARCTAGVIARETPQGTELRGYYIHVTNTRLPPFLPFASVLRDK